MSNTVLRALLKRVRAANFFMLITTVAVLVGLSVICRAWLAPATTAEPSISPPNRQALPLTSLKGSSAQERVEAETITIRPRGFEPGEIQRPKGRFILAIDNRSGLAEVSLRLTHEDGSLQREARAPNNKLDWREIVDLPPGHYTLTEANHPEWVCRITITAP